MYASYVDETDYACAVQGGTIAAEDAAQISNQHNASHLLAGDIAGLGQCWAFQEQARVIIKLSRPLLITAVTYEHIARDMLPDAEALRSAPRSFRIAALPDINIDPLNTDTLNADTLPAPIWLGNYTFDWKKEPRQRFVMAEEMSAPASHVMMSVRDNCGNKQYTCVYRLRVHGIPQDFEKVI
ncbi:SUN domain-containing protein 3-like [Diaphorina citri]|uniref:SUN domain-containing protein 3-like n=1 Tax=Diaphorina citri TaxID=121845 RepID=A0A1S3CZ02_DIACI|nr:SUN domain-containing protein 3-like [Diaphorina citri]XP_026678490.1 SUN domain-containing protein 3-like [Diaphorina citri]XP_026678491.1 SUN domain-containing protein 3-like [Diaphorina citri]XP_026678492.1 SUN domain-containing protein 3-like [Diaphorina citri]